MDKFLLIIYLQMVQTQSALKDLEKASQVNVIRLLII